MAQIAAAARVQSLAQEHAVGTAKKQTKKKQTNLKKNECVYVDN